MKMTQAQAKTFTHGHSLVSESILLTAAKNRGCNCQPYQDWFTYNRWQALGMQVQKGEKGTKLTVSYVDFEIEDIDGSVKHQKRPITPTVFCRCQVKPKGEK